MSSRRRRAIIIGAGPAGSIAGILLARRGWDVTIIEQHRFPRDKVCGECLSWLAIDVLKRLALELPHVTLRRASFISTRGAEATISLPREMWTLSRKRLDDMLLAEAHDAGAKLIQPARCEGINNTRVTLRDLENNTISTIHADIILRADGKAPSHTQDLGIKAHFENVDAARDTVALFALPGSYFGLAPIENGHWNLAMSVPSQLVRAHNGNLDALFESLLAQSPISRLRNARRTSDWQASPLPRFPVQKYWPQFQIPLGNAAAALEPIGGEGMGLAMRSAEFAAIALDEDRSVENLRRSFHRMWSIRRTVCRGAALALSSPKFSHALIRMLQLFPTSAGCGEGFAADAVPCSRS